MLNETNVFISLGIRIEVSFYNAKMCLNRANHLVINLD